MDESEPTNTNPHLDVWKVRETDFPFEASPSQQLKFLLKYAILAPSSHNAQPWLFSVDDRAIEIHADRSRALRVIDPDDRQLFIACGCALFHLRLAMEHFGHEAMVDLFPDPGDPDLVARVARGSRIAESEARRSLFAAILRRRTNRQAFEDRSVELELVSGLSNALEEHSVWLHFIGDEMERRSLADLVAEGDRRQWASRQFRRELAAWTHPLTVHTNAGIPHDSLNPDDLLSYTSHRFIRTFDLGNGKAALDRDIVMRSPKLCILGTAYDEPHNWVETGQALAHLLLLARHHELHTSFLNQPLEIEDLRPQVARAVGSNGFPQLILRMGYGSDVHPTPRRSVPEVLWHE